MVQIRTLLVVVLAFLSSCGNIQSESGTTSTSYPSNSEDLTKNQIIQLTTDYSLIEDRVPIAVGAFTNEFEVNSLNAEEKYTGKDVKLRGKVNSVDNDFSGEINVVLIDPSEEFTLDKVSCNGVGKATARQLKKGDIVTVYGNVRSTDFGVAMNWCYFGEDDGYPPSRYVQELKSE